MILKKQNYDQKISKPLFWHSTSLFTLRIKDLAFFDHFLLTSLKTPLFYTYHHTLYSRPQIINIYSSSHYTPSSQPPRKAHKTHI